MKIFISLDGKGINNKYHFPLWTMAAKALGFKIVRMEEANIAVMWGVTPPTTLEYMKARNLPCLVMDFPYWNRCGKIRPGNEFYKISLNGQHPAPYIMNEDLPDDRYWKTGGPLIHPWRKGGDVIVLAGMGAKAATQNGYRAGEWECRTAEIIKQQTDLPIVYRPKPKHEVPNIANTIRDDTSRPIEEALKNAASLVCHHGNPTVTALAMGIPIFMNGPIGAASHFASFDFRGINSPRRPEGREKFFANIAYWQWSVDEIKSGIALRSYLDRGLLGC